MGIKQPGCETRGILCELADFAHDELHEGCFYQSLPVTRTCTDIIQNDDFSPEQRLYQQQDLE